jgi:predicted nucleic acid-binding protein
VIGLDTNVLARYFVEEADADAATEAQRQAARQLIESGQDLFLPKTVALEQALAGLRSGLDFADALHHASCRDCEVIASFDNRGFPRRIRQLNLSPLVVVPTAR